MYFWSLSNSILSFCSLSLQSFNPNTKGINMSQLLKCYAPILILLLIFSFNTVNFAQQLDHIQGEILIETESGINLESILAKFESFENARTSVQGRELVKYPKMIYSFKFDYNRINETRFLESIRNTRGVKAAQFNHLIEYRLIPDDPQFVKQWQYLNDGSNGGVVGADIDVDLAWNLTTGGLTPQGDTIVACVIDGGMDADHLDFGDNLWKNWDEIPNNGIDDDNNGYVDDFNGWSTYDDNDDVFRGGSHGTPVAGIIGAQGNNGVGVSGVNWDVKLMIIRGGGNEAAALEAYAYPYKMRKLYNDTNGEEGAFVVTTNASWGTDLLHWQDAPIWCSFYDSLGMIGIISCGATANANYNIDEDGDMPTSCPSDYLISVTNMNIDDVKVSGAGYGLETIDLGAYGQGTWTTKLGNTYGGFGGTSGATPHVTGAVALAYSMDCDLLADLSKSNPGQAAILVKEFILNGVKPNQSLEGKTRTGGKLNVNNSLLLLDNFCGDCPFPVGLDFDTIGAEHASFSWAIGVDSLNFDLVYRQKGNEEWDTLWNIQSPYELEGLSACTEYELKIKTRCSDDEGSYSFVFDFATDGCCMIPETHIETLSEDFMIIELQDILATNTYTLEYKLFGDIAWQSISRDTNVFELPLPDTCQVYLYRYKSLCTDQETDFSEIFISNSDCQGCTQLNYCEIEGNNFFEHIDTLAIASFNNISGEDSGAYGDYAFAKALTLKAGQKYDFALTPGFNDTKFDEYIHVYLDLDIDGIFSEDELILDAFSDGGAKVLDQLNIPIDIAAGFSRLRVIMSFQEVDGPCSSLTYGEIEDYCVILDNEVSECLLGEITIDSLSINVNAAHLFWNHLAGSENYHFRYKRNEDLNWMEGVTSDTSIIISELDSCANYEFQLKEICIDGEKEYTESYSFQSDCPNAIFNSLVVSSEIDVFPNPFTDQLMVQIQNPDSRELIVSLVDIKGQILFKEKLNLDQNNTLILEKLQEKTGVKGGVYYLKATSGKKHFVKKVISLR